MEKDQKIIDKYNDLLKYLEDIIKNSQNPELVSFSKNMYKDVIRDLSPIEQKEESVYKEMVKKATEEDFSLEEEPENIELSDEVKSYIESIEQNSDSTVKVSLIKMMNKLKEDLKNPNDALINTWLLNYKNLIKEHNLNEKYMIEYMKHNFLIFDTKKLYVDRIEDLYYKVKEEPIVKKDHKKEDSNSDENELSDKPLKIVSSKKVQLTRKQKILTGLACVLGTGFVLSSPELIPAFIVPSGLALLLAPLGVKIYKMFKDYRYRNSKLEKFLSENDLEIDKDGKTIINKETGETITEESLGKEQYNFIKKQLIKIGGMESKLIPIKTMTTKLTSMLLKTTPVKYITKKFNERKSKNEEYEDTIAQNKPVNLPIEGEEILKGMGKI